MPFDSHASLRGEIAAELRAGLRALDARDQRRTLAEISGVNLCSNDYLGLATNRALRDAIAAAVQNAPRVAATGSRLLSGHCAAWDELENEFAEFAGVEAALFFNSGYAANLGLLTALLGKEDLVFSDELNHASIIDGIRLCGARKLIYPHKNLSAIEAGLREHDGESGRRIIITESVFSMDGDSAPLKELSALAQRFGAGLIVDEAHATAVHGPGGRGLAAAAGIEQQAWAIMHTCGKALASSGAFVCGSAALKDHLINHARTFIYSTALPPYMAGQVQAALRLAIPMNAERAALLDRARRFSESLRADGWDTAASASQIIPIIVGDNAAALSAAAHLQRQGIAVRAIRPPTVPEGRARLRLSLTSEITDNSLGRLREALASWRENYVFKASAKSA